MPLSPGPEAGCGHHHPDVHRPRPVMGKRRPRLSPGFLHPRTWPESLGDLHLWHFCHSPPQARQPMPSAPATAFISATTAPVPAARALASTLQQPLRAPNLHTAAPHLARRRIRYAYLPWLYGPAWSGPWSLSDLICPSGPSPAHQPPCCPPDTLGMFSSGLPVPYTWTLLPRRSLHVIQASTQMSLIF